MSIVKHFRDEGNLYGTTGGISVGTTTKPSPRHSRLSPSKAGTWTLCTASVGFIERNAGVLPKDSSAYADEGTKAHGLGADVLSGKTRLVGTDDVEMLLHVRAYIEFVRSKVGEGDKLLVERRTSLFYLPEQHGTVDAAIIGPKGVYIADFKYGVGVSVYAKGNKQLAIYAESLIRELEAIEPIPGDTLVTLAIYQPRDRNDPEPVRLWVLSRNELADFCAGIELVAAEILANPGGGVFVADPEKQCKFCPATGICEAFARHGLAVVSDEPAELAVQEATLTRPESLTREQRVKVLGAKKTLIAWLEAVENQEVSELMTGAKPVGFKLVEGKTNRQWRDEEAAKKLLRNYLAAEITNPPSDLISPAQAEKALKGITTSTRFENALEAAIIKPPGKATIVPESDKRPALMLNPASGLENQDEDVI